jgi:hypothetical protein
MLNPSIKRGVTGLQNFPLLSGGRVCGSTVSELAGTKILRDLPDSALNELPVQEQRPAAAVHAPKRYMSMSVIRVVMRYRYPFS